MAEPPDPAAPDPAAPAPVAKVAPAAPAAPHAHAGCGCDHGLQLLDWVPRSELVLPVTHVPRARFPAIDAHNHLGAAFGGGWDTRPVSALVDVLDAAQISRVVDLDGGFGAALLERHLDHFKAAAPERFSIFGGVDWSRWAEDGARFGERAAAALRAQAARGAEGLKVWKDLGLHVRDEHGARVPVDDPRLDPIWVTCAELRWPVTIHVADPKAFFRPLDPSNERYDELARHPEWHFGRPGFPSFDALMGEWSRLVARHPDTIFIGAHVGNCAEDLGWVSALLDRSPNLYVDVGARFAELGRQPNAARRFFAAHADRVLFGLDHPPSPKGYARAFRFFESDDDWFNPTPWPEEPEPVVPAQGRWYVSGLALPEPTLAALYADNAGRALAGLRPASRA